MINGSKKYKNHILKFIQSIFHFSLFEKLICRLSQNKNTNSFIVKLIPENKLYPPNSIRYAKRNGINYILDISDYQNWLVYFGLNNDRPDELFKLVKKGSVIVDIGSNIGQTAMTLAKLGGKDATILGFEPDPVNYSKAIENLNINNFKNIKYFNIGLGSQKRELPLKINSPLNRGGNRIDRSNNSNSIMVKIERLDDIIAEQKIMQIDLIKIDVEGFEFEVLTGAKKTLQQFKPVLFIEIDDNNLHEQGSSATELINFISELGYNYIDSKTQKPIINLNTIKNCHFDIICS